VIRHHDEDAPGLVGEALCARGAAVDTHLYRAPGPGAGTARRGALPEGDDLSGYDHLVVLGSSRSVYEQGAWVGAEIDWLRRVRLPVLGICFGAQLLSAAFGGSVERSPAYELGWVRVEPVPPDAREAAGGEGADAGSGPRPSIEPGPWFEFHGDRCVLPPAARVLARTDVCVQAFTLGPHLGVQFHPEVDRSQLERWIASPGGREAVLAAGRDPDDLVAETAREEPAARARAARLVAAYLDYAAAGGAVQPPAGRSKNTWTWPVPTADS